MKVIETKDAVGHILCHDITQIIPGKSKGVVFAKGHKVKEEDIEVLLSVGKEHLYVWEEDESMLHENDAAQILCDLCMNDNIRFGEAHEGKVSLFSEVDGIFSVDIETQLHANCMDGIIISTRESNSIVKEGDMIASVKVVPLTIKKDYMDEVKALVSNPILSVAPFKKKKVAIITTGSEVYHGRIEDAFLPVLKKKLAPYKADIISSVIVDDKPEFTQSEIEKALENNADIILCTGGMSVDPDDKTPKAIKDSGASIVTYGTPVLPGAMFLYGFHNETVIMGLPGAVIFDNLTVFDAILSRTMADIKLSKRDIASMGNGGLLKAETRKTFE